jgi:hypothetical protein
MIAFITGLPRSRTNWFAQYFDGLPDITAHHEVLNGLKSKQEFYDAMEAPGYVINSDSGLFVTNYLEQWPDAPCVVIHRGISDVFNSLRRLFATHGFPMPNFQFLVEQREAINKIDGLHVQYSDINDRLPEIHEYLGIPYDAEYAEKAKDMNMQQTDFSVDFESYTLWGAF